MSIRRPFVVGNWKMNRLLSDGVELTRALVGQAHANVEVGIAPPFTLLCPLKSILNGSAVRLGGQNVYCESSGAFTGEIAPPMLVDAGCSFVIIGHSERRQLFGETGLLLAKKVRSALAAGLDVIYCIGETLQQRDDGLTLKVLERQLADVLSDKLDWQRLTVAYEPVWAIGTGRHATTDQAQQAHTFIRNWLRQQLGTQAADAMRIQYGGSVKPDNAADLLAAPDVDGALVGGASLKADDFLKIIEAASMRH